MMFDHPVAKRRPVSIAEHDLDWDESLRAMNVSCQKPRLYRETGATPKYPTGY